MKVSIITIAYNSEATIEATIRSVISQSYPNIEYIIIDGKSKDSTLSIIEKYTSQISRVVSEPDKGIYDAMNKGVRMATGDIIGILNSDDFYADSDVIKNVVSLFESTKCDATYADLVYVNRLDEQKILRTWISGDYRHGAFLKGWMPPHPTFFVKADVYKRFGQYSTELRSSADYEFMLRVLHKQQIKVAYLNRVITKMRAGGQSNVTLKNRLRANKEDRMAWSMNGLRPQPWTLILKPLSKLQQFFKR
jgi:glycosyltransferase involved in cell wall biosynthesis